MARSKKPGERKQRRNIAALSTLVPHATAAAGAIGRALLSTLVPGTAGHSTTRPSAAARAP